MRKISTILPLIVLVLVLLTSTVSHSSGTNTQELTPAQDWVEVPLEIVSRTSFPSPGTTSPTDEPIDACIAYTQAVVDRLAEISTWNITKFINWSMDQFNQYLIDSGAPELSFRIMPPFQVSFQESGDMGQMLSDLQQGVGGLSLSHTKREEYGCDLLQLLFYYNPTTSGGLAYQMDSSNMGWDFRDWAVSISKFGPMDHEWGHNLGGAHQIGLGNYGVTGYAHAYITQSDPCKGTKMTIYPCSQSTPLWSSTRVPGYGDVNADNIRAFVDVSWPIARTWRSRTVSDEQYIFLNPIARSGGLEPTAITSVAGYVLVPDAWINVSIDGANWNQATVDGNTWQVDIDLPPDSTELYARVNSGAVITIPIERNIVPDAAVEGIVTDADSSAPLDGAVVSTNLGGFEATTDPDGFYYLEVASGSQTVTLGHEVVGYPRKVYRAEQNVNPYVGDTIQLDFNLTPTVFDNLIFLPLVQRGG